MDSRSGPVIIVTTIIIDHGHWGRMICLPTSRGEWLTIPNFGHEKAAKVWKIFPGGGGGSYLQESRLWSLKRLLDVYNLCEGLNLLQFVSILNLDPAYFSQKLRPSVILP